MKVKTKENTKVEAQEKGFVYILECADGTLYTGSTNDLTRRLTQHNTSKQGARYTKMRRPVVLKYKEELPSLSAARSREAALKRLRRKEKLALFSSSSLS